MGKIVLLDDLTINKIAAGEVVERPASVVKEMMENSIDAGATKITVEIKNGGISFIRISDNGKGIAEDDMEIAFERHATSKIRVADDILKVKSMGFRGEALASIAAISNVEMISRTQDSSIGHKIVIEGGKIISKEEVGAPIGTTITVKNLFFNTPVRYKFLKKDYTESGYIEDAISRLALANTNIAFKLINTGKPVIQTNGNGNIKDVVYNIYGKDIAESIIITEYELDGIKVKGVVGNPSIARSNRSNQVFFINGRYVKDRTLNAATEQAFKPHIPANKYGFVILNLEMDPSIVDVNVHPAKLEVRFEDENKVFRAVFHAIQESLEKKHSEEKRIDTPKVELENSEAVKEMSDPIIDIQVQSDEVAKTIMEDEKVEKRSKLPFFKKGKKDEETPEEKENLLEEVYKFRKGLEAIGVSEVPTTSVYTPIFDEDSENDEITPIEKNDMEIPSEEQVQEMTEELIKQRQSKEILDEAIKNTKIEIDTTEPKKEENTTFDDMYTKIFGERVTPTTQEVTSKNLSDNEKKVFEEITSSVRNSDEVKQDNEIKIDELPKEVEEAVEKEETVKTEKIEREETAKVEELEQEETAKIEELENNIDENQESQENLLEAIKETGRFEEFEKVKTQDYRVVGVAFDNFIIAEIDGQMCIIDGQAANEKVLIDKIKKSCNSDEKDSQIMLLPDIISLTYKETELIKDNLELFQMAGFDLDAFGENTIKLISVPTMCIDMNTKHLFLELLDEMENYPEDTKDKKERFIIELAHKVSARSNMKWNETEIKDTMDKLMKTEKPFNYEDGKSIVTKMSKYEIERKFSRK